MEFGDRYEVGKDVELVETTVSPADVLFVNTADVGAAELGDADPARGFWLRLTLQVPFDE